MTSKLRVLLPAALLLAASPFVLMLTAQDNQPPAEQQEAAQPPAAAENQVAAQKNLLYRASVLEDMKVWSPQGEELGEVEDIMINFDKGQVLYAAIEYGGALGVGEKLIAVPWNALKVKQAKGEYFLELNTTKEKLDAAPGFDEKEWPTEADRSLVQ